MVKIETKKERALKLFAGKNASDDTSRPSGLPRMSDGKPSQLPTFSDRGVDGRRIQPMPQGQLHD